MFSWSCLQNSMLYTNLRNKIWKHESPPISLDWCWGGGGGGRQINHLRNGQYLKTFFRKISTSVSAGLKTGSMDVKQVRLKATATSASVMDHKWKWGGGGL